MGVLIGETETIVPYDQPKSNQKLIRKNAVLQLVELLNRFQDFKKSASEEHKYGTEAEGYLLNKIKYKGKPNIL